MEYAILNTKGVASFDLVKFNDRYFPMLPSERVVQDGGEPECVYNFLSCARLEEQEDTARLIGADKQEFAFMEKYGALFNMLLNVAPAIFALIAVIIAVKTNSNTAKEIRGFATQLGGVKDGLTSIASHLASLVGKGGSLTPPLG